MGSLREAQANLNITQNESVTQDEPIQCGLYLDPPLWMRVVASFN
jgi:hypothetical protein